VRQYNLVAVLGRNAAASGKAEAGGSSGSPDNSSASREGLTLGEGGGVYEPDTILLQMITSLKSYLQKLRTAPACV
jgi:hypothetical protein